MSWSGNCNRLDIKTPPTESSSYLPRRTFALIRRDPQRDDLNPQPRNISPIKFNNCMLHKLSYPSQYHITYSGTTYPVSPSSPQWVPNQTLPRNAPLSTHSIPANKAPINVPILHKAIINPRLPITGMITIPSNTPLFRKTLPSCVNCPRSA